MFDPAKVASVLRASGGRETIAHQLTMLYLENHLDAKDSAGAFVGRYLSIYLEIDKALDSCLTKK